MTDRFPSEKDDRMLRMSEVSRWLAVDQSTLYKWIKAGRFPKPVALGDEEDQNSASRFFKAEIEEWLYARPRGRFQPPEKALARAPGMRKNAQPD